MKITDTTLHLPDEIIKNAAETRAKVFDELQEYYRKELNLHDFSQRLGHLMTLVHGAGVSNMSFGCILNQRFPGSRYSDERRDAHVLDNVRCLRRRQAVPRVLL